MATAQPMKIEFSHEATRTLKDLTRALQEHTRVQVEIARQPVPQGPAHETRNAETAGDYHDDETMMKVAEALRHCSLRGRENLSLIEVQDLIGAMQNQGILVRERR